MSLSNEIEPGVFFDREKFVATIHYVIARAKVETLGRTKLHKCLYYADMLHYLETKKSLTGVDYIKEPFGPTAKYLRWGVAKLEERGAVAVSRRSFHGLEKYDFVSQQAPDVARFSEYEIELLNDVIEFVCGFSAKEISEISHAKPWQNVEMGERISYASAFLLSPVERPSKSDCDWAAEQFKRRASA